MLPITQPSLSQLWASALSSFCPSLPLFLCQSLHPLSAWHPEPSALCWDTTLHTEGALSLLLSLLISLRSCLPLGQGPARCSPRCTSAAAYCAAMQLVKVGISLLLGRFLGLSPLLSTSSSLFLWSSAMFVYSLSLLPLPGALFASFLEVWGGGGGGGVHLHPHQTPSSTSNAEPAGPSCTLCVSLLDSGLGTALCPWCLCPLLMHGFHYRGTSPLNGASAPLTIMGPLSPSFTQWSLCWPPQGSLPSLRRGTSVPFIHSMGPLLLSTFVLVHSMGPLHSLTGGLCPLSIVGPSSPSITHRASAPLSIHSLGPLPSHHVSFIHSMGPLPLPLSWDLLLTSVPSSHSLGPPPSLHRGTSVPSSHSLGPPPLSIVGPLSPPVTHWDLLSIVGPLSPPVTHWDLISPSWDLCPLQSLGPPPSLHRGSSVPSSHSLGPPPSPLWDLCPLQSLTGTSSLSQLWDLCPLQSLTGTSSLSPLWDHCPLLTHWCSLSWAFVPSLHSLGLLPLSLQCSK